jgi:CMP-N-acetylneuraminic acid synthetase
MKPLVLGVITARGQSKGVPQKNIKPVLGHPLIAYTIVVAVNCPSISRTIVSTEDPRIAAIARDWGAEVPFMRPTELAGDYVPHVPVLQHAVRFAEKQEGRTYDFVFTLQPTAPLREVSDLEGAIEKIVATDADSVVGLVKIEDHHPLRIKRVENDRIVPFWMEEPEGTRRQDLEPRAYVRAGSIYVTKRDIIMNQGSVFGAVSMPWFLSQDKSTNVDNEYDLLVLEHFVPKLFKNMKKPAND